MKKASRLFITRDFSTFKKWFINMFTGHTAFMQANDPQVAAFTNTSWAIREEKPMDEYLNWYTSYCELWSEKNQNFSKFPENLHVVYLDRKLDDDDMNFLIRKIEQMSDKISIYSYLDDSGSGATPIRVGID